MSEGAWPFAAPPNTAAITTRQVLEEGRPILIVTHDAEDGAWQFLCGTTNNPEEGRVIGIGSAVKIDPTLQELAGLPRGWRATRTAVGAPWERSPA